MEITHVSANLRPHPSLLTRIGFALSDYRQRQRLETLSDDLLDDIGISRDKAETEANRRLWDAPNHWHRP